MSEDSLALTTSYVLENATVLDGSAAMTPQPGRIVVVKGRTIAFVGSAQEAAETDVIPADATHVDLGGAYLMPGLVNLHAHLIGTGDEAGIATPAGEPVGQDARATLGVRNPAKLREFVRCALQAQLRSGVTTLRDAGEHNSADIAARDAIEAGEFLGPRLIPAGNGITVPHGHASGTLSRVAHDAHEAVLYVRDFAQMGAGVIKLFVTGGVMDATKVGEPGVLRMSPQVTAAACDEAHRLGLPVMAHVEGTEGVKVALECGVDTIEHGAPMTPEIVALYKTRGSSVTCTISPAVAIADVSAREPNASEMLVTNARIVAAGIVKSARQALENGITVGLGTDSSCPYITQYDMWRELAYFHAYTGVSTAFALHTATQVNAGVLGLGKVTGTVAPGFDADLIACAKNPLDDLSALRDLTMVMTRGTMAADLPLPRLAPIDELLDNLLANLPRLSEEIAPLA